MRLNCQRFWLNCEHTCLVWEWKCRSSLTEREIITCYDRKVRHHRKPSKDPIMKLVFSYKDQT